MAYTPQQIKAELARRELARRAASKATPPAPSAPAAKPSAPKPYDPTLLEDAADFFSPLAGAAGRIQETMPMAASLVNPSLGLAQYAGAEINKASGQVGEATAERLGAEGMNPYGAAALGMGASIVSNPMTWVGTGAASSGGRVLKPTVPASRAFDVATADKWNMPTSRADRTGGIGAARVETGLSGTITGGPIFQKLAQQKMAALENARSQIGSRFGTREPLSASGLESKLGMQGEMGAGYQTAVDLYKKVPDNKFSVGNFEQALNDIDFQNIDKSALSTINDLRGRFQKQPPPTEATSPKSFGASKQIQNVEIPPSMEQVPGEGNVFAPGRTAQMESTLQSQYRVGPQTPDLPIISDAANKTGEPYAVFQGNTDFGGGEMVSNYILRGQHPRSGGNFNAQQLSEMGIKIKGRTQKAAELGHSPVDAPAEVFGDVSGPPGFQTINEARNLLSREIKSDTKYNPIMGNQMGPKATALSKLKKALDKDISEYVERNKQNKSDPLGKWEAEEFDTAFNRANSFYGDYQSLKNHPLVEKLSKVPDSDIPKTVFASGRIEDVNIAKAALGQKGFNAAKKQYFNELLESKNIESTLAKESPEFLKGVFNDKELNALREMASLKKTSLTAEKLAGNPSGTAQRLGSYATLGGLGGLWFNALKSPTAGSLAGAAVTTAGVLGIPYAASKLYTGWGSKGVPYSYGTASTKATSIGSNVASTSRSDALREFARRYIKINE